MTNKHKQQINKFSQAGRRAGSTQSFTQEHCRISYKALFVSNLEASCRCSKIMSPHNCNEKMSPSKDGDIESKGVATNASDRESSGRAAERKRSGPSTAP